MVSPWGFDRELNPFVLIFHFENLVDDLDSVDDDSHTNRIVHEGLVAHEQQKVRVRLGGQPD